MKIAVISDIHENFHNLVLALEKIEQEGVEQILFLGDFMNNGIAKILATAPIPTLAIWGNNDGDKVAITRTSLDKGSNLTVPDGTGTYGFAEFDGRKIFITHAPILARPMAKSGEYDAVFCGHDHIRNEEKIGECIIGNPGEISAHKTGEASFLIYDTKTNQIEFVILENTITTKTDITQDRMDKIQALKKSSDHGY